MGFIMEKDSEVDAAIWRAADTRPAKITIIEKNNVDRKSK